MSPKIHRLQWSCHNSDELFFNCTYICNSWSSDCFSYNYLNTYTGMCKCTYIHLLSCGYKAVGMSDRSGIFSICLEALLAPWLPGCQKGCHNTLVFSPLSIHSHAILYGEHIYLDFVFYLHKWNVKRDHI